MKMPLHVEKHLYESGPVWWIIDSDEKPVARDMAEANAKLISELVNRDWLVRKGRTP